MMKSMQNFKGNRVLVIAMRFLIFSLFSASCNAAMPDNSQKELAELKAQYKESMLLIKALSKKVEDLEKKSTTAAFQGGSVEEERVEELEEMVSVLEEKVGDRAFIQAFDALEVNLGGFLHSTYTYVDAEDGDAGSFNRQNFELLISAQLNESWSAFFAGGFLRESDDPFEEGSRLSPEFNNRNKNPEILSWANYQYSDAINLRIGRFLTPHGIINVEHFPAVLLDPEQPQFLRPFGGNTLFANFSTGLQFHGNQYFGDDKWSYNAYVSNFTGNPEDEIYGAMTEYTWDQYGLTAGLNYAHGSRSDNSEYDLGGIHVLLDKDQLLWKNEVYITTGEDSDRLAFYTQPAWRITPEWIAFYRFDYLDNGVSTTTENVFGLNYLPYSNVRLRATYTYKDFDEGSGIDSGGDAFTVPSTNANIFQLSGTFSF